MNRTAVVCEICTRLQTTGLQEPDHRALLEAAVTMLYALNAGLEEAEKAGGIEAPYSVRKYMEGVA